MNDFSDIVLNIAVGGCINQNTDCIERQVNKVLHEIIDSAKEFNNSDYNFSGSDIKVNLFSTPFSADAFWTGYADRNNMQFNIIVPSDMSNDNSKLLLSKVHTVTNINANGDYFAGSGSVMPDWIADQVDLSVLLWDGSETFNNREIWALIQACKRNNIPSVWIDINSPDDIYWISESYFDGYTYDKLKVFIAKLFCKNSGAFNPPQAIKIPFWRLWNSLYNRFMKKYKAKIQPLSYIDDKILDKDYISNDNDKSRELSRIKIVNWFNKYDRNAILYSQKYRTSIYLRSIMPFIATIFISIGFYVETVFGFIYKVPGININPWSILAGLGFLIHGLINFYMYELSGNSNVMSWHLRFVDNRFIAEVLRLTAHFAPFGIPVSYKSSLNRFGNKISKNPHVTCELRRITRDVEMASVKFDKNTADELFENLTHMIDDQIVYHENSSKRYATITTRLKKLMAFIFLVGLIIVVLRGGFQFALVYFKTDISNNGINFISFLKSFANMLALIFPAWA